MKKLNKKGFTLIEMLVVIAIIAILVAIIVPTVTKATTKAKYAADAANLRSATAEAEIYVLSHEISGTGEVTLDADVAYTDFTSKVDGTSTPVIKYNTTTGVITATLNSKTATELGIEAE